MSGQNRERSTITASITSQEYDDIRAAIYTLLLELVGTKVIW